MILFLRVGLDLLVSLVLAVLVLRRRLPYGIHLEPEVRALAFLALYAVFCTVKVEDALGDRKAQACSFNVALVVGRRPVIFVPYVRLLI